MKFTILIHIIAVPVCLGADMQSPQLVVSIDYVGVLKAILAQPPVLPIGSRGTSEST
jgi:hypothetical protein